MQGSNGSELCRVLPLAGAVAFLAEVRAVEPTALLTQPQVSSLALGDNVIYLGRKEYTRYQNALQQRPQILQPMSFLSCLVMSKHCACVGQLCYMYEPLAQHEATRYNKQLAAGAESKLHPELTPKASPAIWSNVHAGWDSKNELCRKLYVSRALSHAISLWLSASAEDAPFWSLSVWGDCGVLLCVLKGMNAC